MKYLGKAEETAAKILEAFKAGTVPQALAPVFIRRADGAPCRAWSFGNQLLTALAGTADARGFRQWEECGRHVVKGAKAFHILVPVMKKISAQRADGSTEERCFPVAFKSCPVFRFEDTDGAPIVRDTTLQTFLDALPLVEV